MTNQLVHIPVDITKLSTEEIIAHCCRTIGVDSVDELRWICEGEDSILETPEHW